MMRGTMRHRAPSLCCGSLLLLAALGCGKSDFPTSDERLLIHGIQKLTLNSIAGFAATSMARRGIEPAVAAAYMIFFLETVGAVCIIFGLFTRLFAAMIFVEFLVIIFVAHWGGGLAGFAWNRQGGGWEYPLFWELIWVAILMRGAGPYSLDAKLGREL